MNGSAMMIFSAVEDEQHTFKLVRVFSDLI